MTAKTAPADVASSVPLRYLVEDFLFHEAAMLDDWRLEEWLELFTMDCVYELPATDAPRSDPATTWSLIHDRRTMLEQRVIRLKKPEAHAEFPHSQTRHMVGNVRVLDTTDDIITVTANFIVTRAKRGKFDQYVGHYQYQLIATDDAFKIKRKRIVLDHDRLDPQGKISFIL